jgi:hypothetical protein
MKVPPLLVEPAEPGLRRRLAAVGQPLQLGERRCVIAGIVVGERSREIGPGRCSERPGDERRPDERGQPTAPDRHGGDETGIFSGAIIRRIWHNSVALSNDPQ